MVASLQSRKDALEAILRDKTLELKQLCLQEAELTGILPPETPIEPGESVPIFRRRQDKHLANLLEAGDEKWWCPRGSRTSSDTSNGFGSLDSIRRQQQPEFQYCEYDAEPRVRNLGPTHANHAQCAYEPVLSIPWNRNHWHRHSVSQAHRNAERYEYFNRPTYSSGPSSAAVALANQGYATLPKNSRTKSRYGNQNRSRRLSHYGDVGAGFDGDTHQTAAHASVYSSPAAPTDRRSRASTSTLVEEPPCGSHRMYPEHHQMVPSNSVTKHLSCQSLNSYTIPENEAGSFRFNSLGRRRREKQWRETSLDTADFGKQPQSPSLRLRTPHIPESPSFHQLLSRLSIDSLDSPPQSPRNSSFSFGESESPARSPVLVDSNVPLESPKNHMVVEVGKWQPYKETTKPFEMSDFYKYSTKFKKNHE